VEYNVYLPTSLRDRFAEVALAKILDSGPVQPLASSNWTWPDEAAQLAYQFADAMMRARSTGAANQEP
jgi:hypothetical protein